MKILVISNYRGYHTARPEAEIFINLAKRGYDITIMTYADAEYIPRFEANGIKIIPNHPTKKYDPTFIQVLKDEIDHGTYDVLHLYNNKAIRNGVMAAKNRDITVIAYRGASSNMAWYNPINYFKFFHPRIDKVICNSEEIRQNFIKSIGYKKGRAITILKGHDLTWYDGVAKINLEKELQVNTDQLTCIVVANNRKGKGIPTLLKAMALLPQDVKINLLIIGGRMERSPIPKLIQKSGHADSIHLLGHRTDVLNIMAASDIIICPSSTMESITKSVIEAMALGCVPIISDIAGNQPLVDHRMNGYVFERKNARDLAKKVTEAYHNKTNLYSLSEKSIEKLKTEINHNNTVNSFETLYQNLQ